MNPHQPRLETRLEARLERMLDEAVSNLQSRGAEAVLLTGSHARGEARPESDVDLLVLGRGGARTLLTQRDTFLLAESWHNSEEVRQTFRSPGRVGTEVPGWREAVILHDPKGVAAELKEEAAAWDWKLLGDAPDRWVADSITGLAEETHRLAGDLRRGELTSAAVQRSVIALHLAPIMAVHKRILYGTEHGLWDRMAQELGPEWGTCQADALGVTAVPVEQGCKAAVVLFRLAVGEARSVLSEDQASIVDTALQS
jgi:Nucleotidyltransferase domain